MVLKTKAEIVNNCVSLTLDQDNSYTVKQISDNYGINNVEIGSRALRLSADNLDRKGHGEGEETSSSNREV